MGFVIDIAKGMLHLHTGIEGEQIIHRDLAVRNILLKKGTALVADMGMARCVFVYMCMSPLSVRQQGLCDVCAS